MGFISVRGAQEHNLKNIDIDIPKNSLVVFTGVSGSGKSSLVFDTIYAESFRRFADASQAPLYVMGNSVWSKMTRPRFRALSGLPPALGLPQRQGVAGKTSTVGTLCGLSDLFRVYYAAFGDIFCRKCDLPLRAVPFAQLAQKVMEDFSGKRVLIIASIVEKRKGSFVSEIEKFRVLGFSKLRVNGSVYDLQDDEQKIKIDPKKLNTIEVVVDSLQISADKKVRIEKTLAQALEHGHGIVTVECGSVVSKFNTNSVCPQCGESAVKLDPRYFSHSSLGQCTKCDGTGASQEGLPQDLFPCQVCEGSRLSKDRPVVRVCGRTYEDLHQLKLETLSAFVISELASNANERAKMKIFGEINRILLSANQLGLAHLILNRGGNTLPPGDLQRLRLASMISNNLTGALYVVDEPCQGLTQVEVKALVQVLKNIVHKGSSVLAVEHHPSFLVECDEKILLGPGAGLYGGHIVSVESADKKIKSPPAKEQNLPSPIKKKANEKWVSLRFKNVTIRNLNKKEVTIYQGKVNILCGRSGTGKSSFVNFCLVPALYALGGVKIEEDAAEERVPYENYCTLEQTGSIEVQAVGYVKPGSVTRSSRRSVASALEILSPLRELFAALPASTVMGLTDKHFSWHSKMGQCQKCEGRGYAELPQKYSQPVRVQCETCLGAKLNSRSLLPRFRGYNMADIMDFTIDQALKVFENQKIIHNRLSKAQQFGLGYVQLGQGMDSLSGGEIQRLNLTLQLKKANLIGAWFILIHPSTGLHEPDIKILGELITLMVQRGASFVLIENREEFVEFADHVVQFE